MSAHVLSSRISVTYIVCPCHSYHTLIFMAFPTNYAFSVYQVSPLAKKLPLSQDIHATSWTITVTT